MSSDLLASHLASVKELIRSSSSSSSEKKKSKPVKALPKTPKGLPQPNIKVGKKRLLTSYVGKSCPFFSRSSVSFPSMTAPCPTPLSLLVDLPNPHSAFFPERREMHVALPGSTQEALKKSEKHMSKVIAALPAQMEKKKKARGDTIRIIKIQHSKRK
jgi:hypothetical protein